MTFPGSPSLNYTNKERERNTNLYNTAFNSTPPTSNTRLSSTERVRNREALETQISNLKEQLENALKNQSPYIQGLENTIKEYEASSISQIDFKNKMEIIEKERFQEKEMLTNITNELNVKNEECITLQNTIATVQTRLTLLENDHKITQGALELSKTVNVKLKEREKELENKLNNLPLNLDEIRHPISDDLSKILTDLEPFMKKVIDLGEEINTLRAAAQKAYRSTGDSKALAGIYKTALEKQDPTYNDLCIQYEILHPQILKTQEYLRNTIESAKHDPVPKKQIEAISAKNNLSMRVMEENDNKFENLLLECKQTLIILDTELKQLNERYDAATKHLNDIDHYLSLSASNSTTSSILGTFMSYKTIARISPTSYQYVSKIKKGEATKNTQELVIESDEVLNVTT